jgi:hypothetical protein
MAAYAAIARIGRTDPVLTLRDLDVDVGDPPDVDSLRSDVPTVVDRGLHGERALDRLRARLERAGELAGQMTFFLFDAESWRR